MLASKIITAALAHAGEEADKDILTRMLSVAWINLGIAELTDAENMFRKNKTDPINGASLRPLMEPVFISSPDDDVPYDYHITTVLLPLWLCWKVFEELDNVTRADGYRVLYENKYSALVPAVWEDTQYGN